MTRSKKIRMGMGIALATGIALVAAGCASGPAAPVATATEEGDPALAALIEEAKAEGSVTLYAVLDERNVQQIQTAFQDEYGIELKYMRATSAEIAQRFSAEADANAVVADVVLNLYDGFINDAVDKGQMQPLEDAGIPNYPNDWMAEQTMLGDTALVQFTRMAIGFNTDVAPEIETWEDLLKPELKGKVASSSTDSAIQTALFYVLSQEYGMDFIEELGAQIPRYYQGGAQVVEALSSTEGWAAPGVVAAGIAVAKGQGAPLGWAVPENTLLSPTQLALVADAPHPAAAKLLVNWLLSEEGLDVMNAAEGQVSPADTAAISAGYISSPDFIAEALAHRDEIKKALGVE